MARPLLDRVPLPRWRAGTAALALACATALAFAPIAAAATPTNAWLAKIGTAGANGTATIQAFTTGTGNVVLKLAKLKASTTLPVALLKTSCKGTTLMTLAAVKTSTKGAVARTSSLTAAQVTAIKKATIGTGKIAIRVGTGTTAKCGLFAAQAVRAYVAGTITVGPSPSGIAITPSGVWVTNWWNNTLARLDPTTNQILTTVTLTLPTTTAGPEALAWGGGSLWMTTSDFSDTASLPGSVMRIDPVSGSILNTVPVGRGSYDLAVGLGAVWVVNSDDGNVQRIDPTTYLSTATVPVAGAFGVAVDATAVWVVATNGTVSRIDPATNQVVATIPTQATGAYIAAGNGSIWVTNPGLRGGGNGSVSRINPSTNQVVSNLPVGDFALHLTVAGGSVWVGMGGEPTLVRLNAASGAITEKLLLSYRIYTLAASDHAVWAVHNLPAGTGATAPPAGVVTHVGY